MGVRAVDAAGPSVIRSRDRFGELDVRIRVPLADVSLEFLAGPNTVLATAYDLRVFFTAVGKPPDGVRPADVLAFITAQRRLSIVSGFFAFLQARGDVPANPVPQGAADPAGGFAPAAGRAAGPRHPAAAADLVAGGRALTAALRTHRDRATVARWCSGACAAVRCWGCGLEDLRAAQRRVFIADGKGGRQRLNPVSGRLFAAVAAYLDAERPPDPGTDRAFVVLEGPRRGLPLSAKGTDGVLTAARRRAGLGHATCHELRHTCLTRLREAGMALEAVQAQAGHASIESTRIYLHLADDWLAAPYRKAAEVIDAQVLAGQPAASRSGR
jgi:integrase/recombinase XerD